MCDNHGDNNRSKATATRLKSPSFFCPDFHSKIVQKYAKNNHIMFIVYRIEIHMQFIISTKVHGKSYGTNTQLSVFEKLYLHIIV